MQHNGMRPIHPGEILREEYLQPLNMSVSALARALHIPVTRINDVIREKRGISADTALRLARYFGTSERFWLKLQMEYELRLAQVERAETIKREVKPHAA
ncbi:MAG: HigA family addiction module antitoxin [Marinospirillum sp.]|nr:HigA family addiction module antitoxin [Marinospirillum sp.]